MYRRGTGICRNFRENLSCCLLIISNHEIEIRDKVFDDRWDDFFVGIYFNGPGEKRKPGLQLELFAKRT